MHQTNAMLHTMCHFRTSRQLALSSSPSFPGNNENHIRLNLPLDSIENRTATTTVLGLAHACRHRQQSSGAPDSAWRSRHTIRAVDAAGRSPISPRQRDGAGQLPLHEVPQLGALHRSPWTRTQAHTSLPRVLKRAIVQPEVHENQMKQQKVGQPTGIG